jgi:purine-nucleoside phosphorylase
MPSIGLILGSGLGSLAESSPDDVVFSYDELPHFVSSTVPGHAGRLIFGELCGRDVVVMQGRFHYYEGYTMDEVTFPVRLMRRLGVEHCIITAAAGAMNPRYRPGDIVILKDFINCMGVNCLRGSAPGDGSERFADMTEAYGASLRKLALRAARKLKIRAYEGVYIAVPGPSYETPAEVRMFRKLGGDVVGMSVVPETMAARAAGMNVLGIAYAANRAAGLAGRPLSHAEVMQTGQKVSRAMGALITGIVQALPGRAGRSGT